MSRRRRTAVEVDGPRRPPGSRHRTTERARGCASRSGVAAAVAQDEAGRRRPPTSSPTSASSGRRRGAVPAGRRRAAPAAGRARRPASRRRPPRHARSSSGRSAIAVVSTTRVAPAAKASRIASAESTPPASWSGTATRDGDRADALEVGRRAAPRAVEVDEVDEPARRAPRSARRSARAGRSGRRCPAAAPGQKTTRERPASRSMAGMTCMRRRSAAARLAGEQPAVEADRQRAVPQQRVVERLEGERVARAGAARRRAGRAAASGRAGTTAGRSAGRCTSWTSAAAFGRSKPVCSTRKSVASSTRQLAAVHPDVEDDPAGPPDRVGVQRRRGSAGRRRSPARASSARSTCPSPRRTRGRRPAAGSATGAGGAASSWRWWPGYASWMLVLLIEARLCSRIAFGSPSTDGVTM